MKKDSKNPMNMTEEEYKKWFLNKFRNDRKNKVGVGGMFESLIGTGAPAFIDQVENMMVTASLTARTMAKEIDKKSDTRQGREEILSFFRKNFYNVKAKSESGKEDG